MRDARIRTRDRRPVSRRARASRRNVRHSSASRTLRAGKPRKSKNRARYCERGARKSRDRRPLSEGDARKSRDRRPLCERDPRKSQNRRLLRERDARKSQNRRPLCEGDARKSRDRRPPCERDARKSRNRRRLSEDRAPRPSRNALLDRASLTRRGRVPATAYVPRTWAHENSACRDDFFVRGRRTSRPGH